MHDKTFPKPRCSPSTFGYTGKEYSRIFSNRTFVTCQEKTQILEDIIYINQTTRTLHMTCNGWYYLGNPSSDELLGIYKYHGKAVKYTQPVQLNNGEEWAFGSCSSPDLIEGATYQIYSTDTIKAEIKDKMYEQAEKFQTDSIKPLTILNIFLDSISRKNLYRNLPDTLKYLNALDPKKFRVFDYKLHDALADNSLPNLFPLWKGEFFQEQTIEERTANKFQETDLLGENAIWNIMRSRGWATMFAAEFCNFYFSYGIGRKPSVNHLTTKFWCAAEPLAGYNDVLPDQRCIGNKNSHEYILNYTLQFVKEYTGLNKYAHVMSVPAHESSGNVIKTVDKDLKNFLKEILNTKDELVIFLAADHGMRYGEWYKLENGGQEHRLPMLLVIVSNGVLERIRTAEEALAYNANRLFTKFDMRSTIEHLSMVPYFKDYRKDEVKNATGPVSIFLNKISDERNCESVGINAEYCVCPRYISFENFEKNRIAQYAANVVIEQINTDAVSNFNPVAQLCKKIELKEITAAQWTSQEFKMLIKVNFTIEADELIEFQSTLMLFGNHMKTLDRSQSYGFLPYYSNGKRFMRITDIRNNYLNEFCEELSIKNSISPNLCICKSLVELEREQTRLLESIGNNYIYTVSNQFETCKSACEDLYMTCSSVGTGILNTCKVLNKKGFCLMCTHSDSLEDYGINNFSCWTYRKYIENPCETLGKNRRPCACNPLYQ